MGKFLWTVVCNKNKKIGEGVPSGADSVSVLGPFFQVRFSKMAQNAAFGLKL